MIEVAGVVGEVGFENVKPPVAVIISYGHAHSGLLVAVVAVSASSQRGGVGESAVVVVAEQHAGLRVHSHIDIRPAVVIKIVRNWRNGIPRAGLEDAGLDGDVGKSAVTVVVIKDVRIGGETPRATHYRNVFPWTGCRTIRVWGLSWIESYVMADEKIKVPIAVVVEPGAARAPSDLFIVDTDLASDVGEGSVSVVVKQNIVSPEATEHVVPAVIVVVTDADASLPACAR